MSWTKSSVSGSPSSNPGKDNQPTMREDIERQFDFEEQEAERLNKAKGLDEEAFPP